MSQLTEREQGENTDEGKSGSAKDLSDDKDMESPSNAGSRCEDQTEPCSGDLSKYMQDGKEDIVNIKEINEEQRKRISELEDKVNEVIKKQEKRIVELEDKVNEVIKNQEKRIVELEDELNEIIKNLQNRISALEEKVNESERILWLYGLPEQEGEDVRKRVIEICSTVVPEAAGNFPHHIGIAQRVGKRKERKPRPVIIKFSDKSTKELLLKTSKSSEYHRSSILSFEKDLTAKEKEKRNKLLPIVIAARKEGKTAYFDGATAIIDSKEICDLIDADADVSS
ncbi:uncharacterized protein LOC113119726 [Carassius auratus]|uniref:Uncharacterized protein LOC113119726 n=1 Tax=Carassius auratus TaxID=7957 RepID=A0A6P6RIT2_CARAU|nr:uncharacterized protein LOC113119726 [Carassius auratus]